jgi:hypothetical protein
MTTPDKKMVNEQNELKSEVGGPKLPPSMPPVNLKPPLPPVCGVNLPPPPIPNEIGNSIV